MTNQPKVYVQRTEYDDYRAWSEDNPGVVYVHPSRFGAIGKLISSNPKKFALEVEEVKT